MTGAPQQLIKWEMSVDGFCARTCPKLRERAAALARVVDVGGLVSTLQSSHSHIALTGHSVAFLQSPNRLSGASPIRMSHRFDVVRTPIPR